jgi:hypothetical protein
VLQRREQLLETKMRVWAATFMPYVLTTLAILLAVLVLRMVSLKIRAPQINALADVPGGTTGRTFAEVTENVGYQLRAQPPPDLATPMILVDRSDELGGDVEVKLGSLTVKGIGRWIQLMAFPSRYSVGGVIVSSGPQLVANVHLRRRQWLGRSRELSYWSFQIPAEDEDLKMRSLRSSAYDVLFRLLAEI